jgi:hypothetical protein
MRLAHLDEPLAGGATSCMGKAPIAPNARRIAFSMTWLQNVQPRGVCTPWMASAKLTVDHRVESPEMVCTGLDGREVMGFSSSSGVCGGRS